MGGEEQVMVGVFLGVEGDITGSMMFLVEQGSAKHLLHKIMGDMVQQEGFSEIEFSAMQEIGNIITGAYLNSLSMMTNLTIIWQELFSVFQPLNSEHWETRFC